MPAITQKQIWAIRFFQDREERLRDRALFDLAIDSKLRSCDLVKLKIGDLVAGSDVRIRALLDFLADALAAGLPFLDGLQVE